MDEKQVYLFDEKNGQETMGLIKIYFNDKAFLQYIGPGIKNFTIESNDYFSCLQELRIALEKADFLILCNGARKDVYPSAMTRQMSRGVYAYKLVFERPLSEKDIVDIFDKTNKESIATVKEQRAFFEKWFLSVSNKKMKY